MLYTKYTDMLYTKRHKNLGEQRKRSNRKSYILRHSKKHNMKGLIKYTIIYFINKVIVYII